MNLIKEQHTLSTERSTEMHMCDNKSHCSSSSLKTAAASQDSGSLPMIDSSIFIEAIQQKGRKREAIPAHWAEGAWRPEVNRGDNK